MARGWESKSVEQQQDEAISDRGQRKVQLSAEQIAEERRREALALSRKRILQQLEVATNPRHREMLQAALAELDGRINRAEGIRNNERIKNDEKIKSDEKTSLDERVTNDNRINLDEKIRNEE
jgi:hypothetical protein